MPLITIETGLTGPDGRQEQLTEYICDASGCPNIATHVLGRVAGLGFSPSVCDEHVRSKQS